MSITFSYDATTVTLPSPEYGDSNRYDTNIQYYILMDGSVANYRKKKNQTLLLNFTGVNKTEIDAFISFYLDNINNAIYYQDSIDQLWLGQIINNPIETVVTRDSGTCALHSFSLQMKASYIPVVAAATLVDDEGNELVDDESHTLIA